MTRSFLAILVLGCTHSYAATYVINPGSSLTTGASSNHFSIFAARQNPAMAHVTVGPNENWRLSYLPTISMGEEIGKVDNFVEELDELIDLLDDSSNTEESVDDVLARFNSVLEKMGEDGYVKLNTSIFAPGFPMYWRSDLIGGTLVAELSLDTQIKLSVLDDELTYDEQNSGFATNSSAYIKSGIEKKFALGYSKPLLDRTAVTSTLQGNLYAGVKLNVINLDLSKQVFRFQYLDGKDIQDVIKDEYDNNVVSSTAVGVDVGLLWNADRYRAGLTVTNINEPSFDYGAIGVDCTSRTDDSIARGNCEIAAYFTQVTGDIKAQETHTRHAVATIDGLLKLRSNWLLTGALDLAKYDDIVGDENQWLHVATAYYPKNRWIPGVRMGYRQNMVGSELGSATAGLSLFGSLTLDMEWGLDSVDVDETTGPRNVAFSVGFEERF